ncbi:MAG: hypothetical protein QM489_01010 [Candidatus Izemoplasma sp.]
MKKNNKVATNPIMKKGGAHEDRSTGTKTKQTMKKEIDQYSDDFLNELDNFIDNIDD